MPVLESSVERKIVAFAANIGLDSTKLNGLGERGKPDRIFWIPGGRPLLMEIKRKDETPRRNQKYKIVRLRKLGYDVCWVDTEEKGKRAIGRALEAAQLSKA